LQYQIKRLSLPHPSQCRAGNKKPHMTNTLVPHEIAVELSKLGFDWYVHNLYDNHPSRTLALVEGDFDNYNNTCYGWQHSAPDIYQAAAWLRANGVYVSANLHKTKVDCWYVSVVNLKNGKEMYIKVNFPDHDTAYIDGIKNALKLINN